MKADLIEKIRALEDEQIIAQLHKVLNSLVAGESCVFVSIGEKGNTTLLNIRGGQQALELVGQMELSKQRIFIEIQHYEQDVTD